MSQMSWYLSKSRLAECDNELDLCVSGAKTDAAPSRGSESRLPLSCLPTVSKRNRSSMTQLLALRNAAEQEIYWGSTETILLDFSRGVIYCRQRNKVAQQAWWMRFRAGLSGLGRSVWFCDETLSMLINCAHISFITNAQVLLEKSLRFMDKHKVSDRPFY